jgi:hypothetical protein
MTGELKQRTEILAPHYMKVLKYNGDNPTKVLKIMPNLIKSIFKVTSTNFFEDRFKWDNVFENNDFFAAWRGVYTEDERTKLWVDVKVQGTQNEKTKAGNVTIWLRAYIITKFKFLTSIDKLLLKIYSMYFYSNQRRFYNEKARRNVDILEKEIRTQLGMRR